MKKEKIIYTIGDVPCEGYVVWDSLKKEKSPGILIAHAWRGLDDFTKEKAEKLAHLGYVAFAADIYGHGAVAQDNNKASALMAPFFLNRKLLRERLVGATEALKKHPAVDPARIGALGFCFGGLSVLELLRSGIDLKAIVSFHGVMGYNLGPLKADVLPPAKKYQGAALFLHGYEDPLVSKDDIQNLQKELNDARVDWQMHIYGQTTHAFSNPQAQEPESGLLYNPLAEKRAWRSALDFLDEQV